MMEFFKKLFSGSDFMPHGHCYLWHTDVLWLNVIGDGFITTAYYSIPFLLWFIVRKRKDVPFHGVYLMFAVFILACGTTHLLEIVNIWNPLYRASGLVKGVTALASIGTAWMLYTLVPSIMAIPSQAQLQEANSKLEAVNVKLENANAELLRTNERLMLEIEERNKVERALRDRETKLVFFHSMVNNASDAVIVTDANFNLTNWNKGAEELFGYAASEVVGKSARDVLQSEFTGELTRERALAQLEQNGFWKGEVRQRRKEGSHVPVLASTAKVADANGSTLGFISVNHDISIRKDAERKLGEAMAALETSNADLKQFAFVASHDLKEPLRKIQVFGERLTDLDGERLSAKGNEFLQKILSAAKRMQSLIEDLLTYASVTDSKHARSVVDLNQVLDGVLIDLSNVIENTSATVRADPLPSVNGVPVQLRQLFQNLIANAIKFRQPEKTPSIEIECKALGADQGKFKLTFRDNGIGFDDKHAEKIFDLFHRLHTKDQYGGSGIGLSVCKRVAENHGGSITAHSQQGEGATFEVTLASG